MKTKNIFLIFAVIGILFNGCVKDEVFQGPPTISDMVLNPQIPSDNQAVSVSVKVSDMNGVKTVTLFYKVNEGTFQTINMTGTNNIYSAQIPGQASETTISFYIQAENTNGKFGYYPTGAPQTTSAYTVGAPLILMNEIYSRGTVEDPDWIEIYNASDVEVNISGYKIYDIGGQSGAKPKLSFPDNTTIPAKGFYVIVTDAGGEASFGLSSGGEEVWLENAKGNIIDNVNFTAMDKTQSYGRNPDGSPNWEILNTITRGAPNSDALPEPIIKMNEIYSQGTTDEPDWIELYNASSFEADISGYKIYDNGGQSGSKPKKTIPDGTVIPAKGFYVIVVDDGGEDSFGLSGKGEEVWLENASGSIIDNVTFPALEVNQSYGRYPDGNDNWQILYVVTKGTPNDNSTPPPPGVAKINEIYSRGTIDNPDWIEIYNPSDNQLDISGYKIYDNGGNAGSKPKKEFPSGTIIQPKGFYVIVVDDDDPSGFGLSSSGEQVWFEDAAGNIIDDVTFPALEESQSYGRLPDGSDNWQILNTVTKGAPNQNIASVIIVMNEIYSRGTVDNPDWIEIYNPSDNQADISGYKIYDNGGNNGTKPKKEFPAGTIIQPKGFYVIIVDDDDPSGFGLSSNGEQVWLEDAAGNIIDDIKFPALEESQSYGRLPDGSDNWQILNTVTKGAPNQNTASIIIVMNEIYSRGTVADPDWIEIYNGSSIPVDISGYKIYDNGGNNGTKPKKEFPAGTIMQPKGFYVIVVDDDDPSGFGLSSNGEQVWLEDASGNIIDNVTFPAFEETQSYGRKPDGSGNFFIFTEITKGSSNNNAGTLP